MTAITADVQAPGGIHDDGSAGRSDDVVVVEHTADTGIVTFRLENPNVRMLAAEDDFELAGYGGSELPVYFNQAPVLNVGGQGSAAAAPPNAGLGQSITPNAAPLRISSFDQEEGGPPPPTGEGRPSRPRGDRGAAPGDR